MPLLNHSINICKCHRSMPNNGTLKRNRAHLKICVLCQYSLSYRRNIQRLIVLFWRKHLLNKLSINKIIVVSLIYWKDFYFFAFNQIYTTNVECVLFNKAGSANVSLVRQCQRQGQEVMCVHGAIKHTFTWSACRPTSPLQRLNSEHGVS